MADPDRPIPVLLAQLAEVRRHLREAPPHHDAGVREALAARVRELERQLAEARARASSGDGR